MPIVLGSERSPYSDTPTPKCFGTVSPLDPQLFSTIVDHAGDLLAGRANPEVFADRSRPMVRGLHGGIRSGSGQRAPAGNVTHLA